MPPLPLNLQELVAEVEALAKAQVSWECLPEIGGLMSSAIQDGIPTIRYREWSEAGIAEELMHLRLMLSGVQLSSPENRHLVARTATMLQNIVHHHVIFPVLTEWGYQPSIAECNGISKQLSTLENSNDLDRAKSDTELEALMAIVYARGHLDYITPDVVARLDSIFSADALSNARQIGNRVALAIRGQTEKSPEACLKTLVECLIVLGLSNVITISSRHA